MVKQNKENVFPTLYDKDSFGNIKTWDIKAIDFGTYSEIVTLYGRAKKIEKRIRITEGKNIGKSNETTHYTQAIAEAESKYTKKQGQGYFKLDEKENEENEKDFKVEDFQDPEIELSKLESRINNKLYIIESDKNGIKFPMLAKDYHKEKHKVVFPCKIQPKFDGYRAIYDTTTKNITSRTGKNTFEIIKESPVLYKELSNLEPGLILDGELYIHNAGDGGFEALGVLRKKPKKITDQVLLNVSKIEYHIYDIIDTKLTFKERNKILKKLLKSKKMLKYVDTYSVENEDEIKEYHGKFISENYEGTIVRNSDGLYKTNSRSSDLLKYKDFIDSEFKIVDFSKENNTTGQGGDLIVWVVQVKKDVESKVRPKGTVEERQELYKRCVKNFKEFKNRNLWVKYFEKTADGNLRFPTSMRNTYTEYIRDEII
jgi:hypothetical protein